MAAESSSSRYATVSSEEKDKLLEDAIPTSTKTATRFWLNVFADFCKESSHPCDLKTVEEEDLAAILEDFYCGVRRQDKSEYKRSSLIAARGALQRELGILQRSIDLKSGKFARANKMLDAVLKEKKRTGREESVVHKNSIGEEDWVLVKKYFADCMTTLDPKKLTQYVWFHTSLHFCLRGNEAQSKLKLTDLVFSPVAGEEAITLRADYMSKNHQGGLQGSSTETMGAIVNSDVIAIFRRYLSKLNAKCDRLFQRSKCGNAQVASDTDIWYMNAPLGHNILGKLIKFNSCVSFVTTSLTIFNE